MPIYDDAKELLGIISEVRRLRDQIQKIGASFEETRKHLLELERRMDRSDIDREHFIEKTQIAAEAGVSVALAKFGGELQAKLVELDLRLQAVERGSEKKRSPKKLPKP
jgi:hypothetical protein